MVGSAAGRRSGHGAFVTPIRQTTTRYDGAMRSHVVVVVLAACSGGKRSQERDASVADYVTSGARIWCKRAPKLAARVSPLELDISVCVRTLEHCREIEPTTTPCVGEKTAWCFAVVRDGEIVLPVCVSDHCGLVRDVTARDVEAKGLTDAVITPCEIAR
jgi:hypothetical protein